MTMGEGEAETTMSSFEFTGALNWIFFLDPRNFIHLEIELPSIDPNSVFKI